MKPLINCNPCHDAFAAQVLKASPGQKHIMIQDYENGCWSFTVTMIAEEVLVKFHTPPWMWGCWCKPLTPHLVPMSFCAAQVSQRALSLGLWASGRLILFLLLTPLKDGCWDVLGQDGTLGDRWWAGSSKERDLTAKEAPDTHVEAGVHCQALCKPSREMGLKGSFPLGKIRWRRRQCTIPPCSFLWQKLFFSPEFANIYQLLFFCPELWHIQLQASLAEYQHNKQAAVKQERKKQITSQKCSIYIPCLIFALCKWPGCQPSLPSHLC